MNPLQKQFERVVIRTADLAHPVTRQVSEKRLIDCDLVGGNIIAAGNVSFSGVTFANCDLVPIKDNYPVYNAIALDSFEMIGGRVHQATILIPLSALAAFLETFPGKGFLTLTGDVRVDQQNG